MPHVCPWWGGYFIDNRLRRWVHNPGRILAPYLTTGMTVLDFGCGMGLFAIAAARSIGDTGQVIAVDLQPQMLEVLRKRAEKAGVAERILTHHCETDTLRWDQPVDFAFAVYSAHEVPDSQRLLREIHDLLRPGGRFLVVEPIGHVTATAFERTISEAEAAGFQLAERPRVRWSHSAVFALP
ncbi:MAG: methyltransferase domain-containing protein [Planctomycetes bacterium]|nr:methyltransferase domain-containing protein [Planctomycetota bacterium]